MKACMTPQEFELWDAVNFRGATPCFDCTPEFHAAMKAAGSCDGEIGRRRPGMRPRARRGPKPFYATEQERQAARRETWRNSKRRAALRAAA